MSPEAKFSQSQLQAAVFSNQIAPISVSVRHFANAMQPIVDDNEKETNQ